MAKFNGKKKVARKSNVVSVVNHEGGVAFKPEAEEELVGILLTSFVQNEHYRNTDELVEQVDKLVDQIEDAKFVAQASVYARNEFGLRSITHILASKVANKIHELGGVPWGKNFFNKVVHRPDDITEILSYYIDNYTDAKNVKLQHALKEGLARAFGKFDAYQLAKYKQEGKAMTLANAVRLLRPAPCDKNGKVDVDVKKYLRTIPKQYRKSVEKEVKGKKTIKINALEALIKGLLKNTDTWEAKKSEAGQNATTEAEKKEANAEVWKEMIEKNMPQFALLRNLRNIIEQAPDSVKDACKLLTDEKRILKSLIMPFRYYQAYKEIKNIRSVQASKVLDALSTALDISCQNIPDLGGSVMLALDKSGSMDDRLSDDSKMNRKEVASLLGAMVFKKTSDAVVMAFADHVQIVNLLKSNSVLANMEILDRVNVGGGTIGYLIPQYMNQNKLDIDNLIVFTDCEMYDGSGYGNSFAGEVKKYRGNVNAKTKIFTFNIAGYGTMQMPKEDKNAYNIYGFSEKMFEVVQKLKTDRKALVNAIKKVEI
jgi:hypothetical protein